MHLRFDLLFEHYLAALEDFLNVRTQLARVRIDNRELLFNPESEGVLLGAHSGAGMSLKNHELSSRVGRMWSARGAGPVSISPEARPVRERMSEALCRSFVRFGVSRESNWGVFSSIEAYRYSCGCRLGNCCGRRRLSDGPRVGSIGILPVAHVACGMGGRTDSGARSRIRRYGAAGDSNVCGYSLFYGACGEFEAARSDEFPEPLSTRDG